MDWENEMLEKYKYIVHYVLDCDLPFKVDIHTHGLPENFNHPNVQIILPLEKNIAHGILNTVVNIIEDGGCFLPNKIYKKILRGAFEVKFVEAYNHGEKLLRMIIPDTLNNINYEKMNDEYKKQYLARFKKNHEQ